MGGRNIPHYIFIVKTIMKIEKKIIKESVGDQKKGYGRYSNVKQNIILTEKQLEKLLSVIKK